MSFTTRQLLESSKVFGISTATDCQRAWWDASDGLDVSGFAADPDVAKMFGGTLPTAGTPPREFLAIVAIRTAKSMWAAAKAITASQVVDVSGCSPGDIVKIHVVSLTVPSTRAVMSHLLAAVRRPALRPLVIGDPSMSGIVLRHPSGRAIEVTPTPLDRAGGSAASVWSAGVVIDEAPRMMGATDAVKNYNHLVDTLRGRLLPGAQMLSIGSPWAPAGPIYNLVKERHGKPADDCVVVRATGPMLNPVWWTQARCDALIGTPSYQTDVLGEFADPVSGLLSPPAVRRAVVPDTSMLPRPKNATIKAAIDPSELHDGGNGFALAIMAGEMRERDGEQHAHFTLLRAVEWRRGALPLVFREIAGICDSYGVTHVLTDAWAKGALKEIAMREGVDLRFFQQDTADRLKSWESFVTAFDLGAISIPDSRLLVGDLLGAKRKLTPTSSTVELPHTPDGRHADLLAAMHVAFSAFRWTPLGHEGRARAQQMASVAEVLERAVGNGGPQLSPMQRDVARRIARQTATGLAPREVYIPQRVDLTRTAY